MKPKHPGFEQPMTGSNVFMNINGWPYLSNEYLDVTQMATANRNQIRNLLEIGEGPFSNSVDIVIDQIGHKTIGNKQAYTRLMNAIMMSANRLGGQLDVIRTGMMAEIWFTVESERTGRVVRSSRAVMNMTDVKDFLDVGTASVGDNVVLSLYEDSQVINVFNRIHGGDRLVVRILRVDLFMTAVARQQEQPWGPPHGRPVPAAFETFNEYECGPSQHWMGHYHQHHMPIDDWRHGSYHGVPKKPGHPDWGMMSHFYRFVNGGRSILLHDHNISERRTMIFRVPVGTINLNRTFFLHKQGRVTFNLQVWRNNKVVVGNTSKIAQLLGVTAYAPEFCPPMGPNGFMSKHMIDMFQSKKLAKIWKILKKAGLLDPEDDGDLFDEEEDEGTCTGCGQPFELCTCDFPGGDPGSEDPGEEPPEVCEYCGMPLDGTCICCLDGDCGTCAKCTAP